MNNKQIIRMTISISEVLFLFGLSWLFFVLTFSIPGLQETFQNFSLRFSTRSRGSLCLPLSCSQKALTIGRPSCHVRSTNPSISILLLEQIRNKALILVFYPNKIRILLTLILTTDQEMDTETLISKDLEALEMSPTDLASINLVYQKDQTTIESESQKGGFQEQATIKSSCQVLLN